MNVGVIGIGRNGKAIATQLVERRAEIGLKKLYLCNRSRDNCDALKEQLETKLRWGGLEILVCNFNDLDDFNKIKKSDIIVLAAGVRGSADRSTAMAENHLIFKEEGLATKLNGFKGYLINLVNPSDIVTNSSLLALTDLKAGKVLGSNYVDTLRYRKLLSTALNVGIEYVDGMVIGTHDELMVPLFSQTSIGGINLSRIPEYQKNQQLEKIIRESLIEYVQKRLVDKGSGTEIEVAQSIYEVIRATTQSSDVVVMSVRGSPEEFVHLTNFKDNCPFADDWWYENKDYNFCSGWPVKFVGGRVRKQKLELKKEELKQFLDGLKNIDQQTQKLLYKIVRVKRKKFLIHSAKVSAVSLLAGVLAWGGYSGYITNEYTQKRESIQNSISLTDYSTIKDSNSLLKDCDGLSKYLLERAVPVFRREEKRQEIEIIRYWILGNQLRARGEFADAKAKYTLALSYDFGQSWSNLFIGHCYKELGDLKHAEEAYKESLKIEPSSSDGHLALANLLKETFKYDEAEKEYQRVLKLDPRNANVHRCLGHLNKDRWRDEKKEEFFEAAKRWYESAVEISPQPYNFIALGHLYKDNHEFERAKEEYQIVAALEENPVEARAVAYFNLGDVADLESRTEEAIKYFEETIRLEPHFYHGFAHFRLGMDYKKKGNSDKAFTAFRSALELERGVKPGLDYADRGRIDQVISQYEAALDFLEQMTPMEQNTLQFHLGSVYLAKAKETEGGAYNDHFYTQKAADMFDKCWGLDRSKEVTEKVKDILELDPYNKTAQSILDIKRKPGSGGFTGWIGHP